MLRPVSHRARTGSCCDGRWRASARASRLPISPRSAARSPRSSSYRWLRARAFVPAAARLRRARRRRHRRVRRLGHARDRDGRSALSGQGGRRRLRGGRGQLARDRRHAHLSAHLRAARVRPATNRRHARRHHPRRGAGGGRGLRGERVGRQCRGDREALPRVPLAPRRTHDRLVRHAARHRAAPRARSGADVRARVFAAVPRQQHCTLCSRRGAALCAGESGARPFLDLGAVDRDRRTRALHFARRRCPARLAARSDGDRHDRGGYLLQPGCSFCSQPTKPGAFSSAARWCRSARFRRAGSPLRSAA